MPTWYWWCTDAAGDRSPSSLTSRKSAAVGRCWLTNASWLADLTGDDVFPRDVRGLGNPRHRQGLSDLPWHKDCGRGCTAMQQPDRRHFCHRRRPGQRCARRHPRSHRAGGRLDAGQESIFRPPAGNRHRRSAYITALSGRTAVVTLARSCTRASSPQASDRIAPTP